MTMTELTFRLKASAVAACVIAVYAVVTRAAFASSAIAAALAYAAAVAYVDADADGADDDA